jgi:hypothetical protein
VAVLMSYAGIHAAPAAGVYAVQVGSSQFLDGVHYHSELVARSASIRSDTGLYCVRVVTVLLVALGSSMTSTWCGQ